MNLRFVSLEPGIWDNYVLLYHLPLSHRVYSKIVGGLEPILDEFIKNWHTSLKDLFTIEKKERRTIAID
jgi:hypothetical protein